MTLRRYRFAANSPRAVPIRFCSRWGLPCRLRCRSRGALLPHLFTLTRLRSLRCYGAASRGLSRRSPEGAKTERFVLCGTFPEVVPACAKKAPPDVIRHRMSMEPGLSSRAAFRPVRERPSGRLTRQGMGISGRKVKVFFSSLRGTLATKQSSSCFAAAGLLRGVYHRAALRADPWARNDGSEYFILTMSFRARPVRLDAGE
jgi:hypothetical protein